MMFSKGPSAQSNHNRNACRTLHSAVPRNQQHRLTHHQNQSGWMHWETIAGEVVLVARLKGQAPHHLALPRITLLQGGTWIFDTRQYAIHT